MKLLGLWISNYTFRGVSNDRLFEEIAMLATTAENAGFAAVFVMDHFYQLDYIGPGSDPMLEGYTVLAGLAARTRRIQLGTLVAGVTYRNPALLAKTITTLDIVSAGRAICGVGAAWKEDEHLAYGFDFPPIGERLSRLEEALQILRAMFRQERASFQGRFYHVKDAMNFPRPVQQPNGPPIMIGGGGEQRTLKLVAQYGDMCNLFGDPATVKHKLEILRGHCQAVGRDPDTILKTRLGSLIIRDREDEAERAFQELLKNPWIREEWAREDFIVGDPDHVAGKAQELLDAGLDGLIFDMPHVEDPHAIELAGKTLSKLGQTAGVR